MSSRLKSGNIQYNTLKSTNSIAKPTAIKSIGQFAKSYHYFVLPHDKVVVKSWVDISITFVNYFIINHAEICVIFTFCKNKHNRTKLIGQKQISS